ncbi:6-phosphogluconolactonase [Halonatronum saccharophilum]|uniref:6-phosphogluconolactonase n=1 Tax=Halonatronum saccharophilum TaxID=150060 RepID=UPI0004821D0B|nr:6-phosphogluconolactonase [Halonatronum saccharophilum]
MEMLIGERNNLERDAAKEIANTIEELLRVKSEVVVGIVGGSSVAGVFSNLLDIEVEWANVHFFMADERLVPLDSDESNFKLAKKTFLNQLLEEGQLSEDNLHPFRYDSDKDDYGLEGYNGEFESLGAKFDIFLLSSGEDGHIASLFSNHQSIKDQSNLYILVEDSPKLPPKRISASRKQILGAKKAIILFFGESKAQAYNSFISEGVSIEDCPARLLFKIKDSLAFVDVK